MYILLPLGEVIKPEEIMLPSFSHTRFVAVSMTPTILSPYKNDRFIQVAAVQFHTRKHQSYHQLPQNEDDSTEVKHKTAQSIC